MVGGGEDSMAKETTGGTAASRRGDPVAALHAWGGGPHDEDGHHRSQVDRQGEVGGGVPIGGGNDELVKIHVRMKRQGWQCIRVSPKAPSMWPCRTVEGEEEDNEIDPDVELEARDRRAVGDAIPIPD